MGSRPLLLALVSIFASTAWLGCSSSDDSGSPATGGTAGDGGGGSGGTGGSATGGTAGSASGGTAGSAGTGGAPAGIAVLEHHNSPRRDGVYTDAAFTKTAAAGLHRDAGFSATVQGHVYAQPLFVEKGTQGKDAVYVVTESNNVHALDATTGAELWTKNVGAAPASSDLPCGNIDPLGITGTPVIDLGTKTIYFDAMTTPDGGSTLKHLIFALSLEDGSTVSGWPVDVSAKVSDNGVAFDSAVQNERGALAIAAGTLYVPYGGHYGDCGTYHGWVVGVPLADPSSPKGWRTEAKAGGSWAPGGVAVDGGHVYVTTGNTMGASTWGGGEAIIRLAAGPTFSGQSADYFTPSNWKALDAGDVDIGGSGPVLVDVAGSTPSKLAVALGKNGVAYLLDRENLGGVGSGDGTTGEGLFSAHVVGGPIINAAAAYTTAQGTYIVFKGTGSNCPSGQSGDLTALKITAGSPPQFTTAWCASQNGLGSPMVTTTDGSDNAIVWGLGAESSQKLRGFDGDTGAVIFDGGGSADTMKGLRRYDTAIAAKGRIYVAGDNAVFAFVP